MRFYKNAISELAEYSVRDQKSWCDIQAIEGG